MSQLKVYKASAGSGKTFRLAVEYMKLALTGATTYRHILAVTFTNKATAEMKSRIIGELHALSKGNPTVYMEVLTRELGWPPERVEAQSKQVLKRILHDYSRFSISTIDSFFQRVIKAFNRELGINAAYNVELDENSILEEAADRLIQSVEEDTKLLDWLNSFASEKMRDGKGWNLKNDIMRLGSEIYNETFKSLDDRVYEKLGDRAFLRAYREKLADLIRKYETGLQNLGKEGLNILALENLDPDEFKGKKNSPANAFRRMKEAEYNPSRTIRNAANDPSAWVTAAEKEPKKSQLNSVALNKLMPKLQEAIGLIDREKRNYTTAKLILAQLYTLGILIDLRKAVKDLCREKGIILISDSGHLLRNVIADSESPFVYEKTGSVYSHFMIDEFQDTSGQQWNNFRPLIGNSLSENNFGMVVGDVKQAIYRWRSGDWRLLAAKLSDSFPAFGVRNEVLNSNWRSHGKIIRFNNTVFGLIPELMQRDFENGWQEANIHQNPIEISIPEIYADSIQQVSNREVEDLGYVRVRFLDLKKDQKKNNEEQTLNELVESVKLLQDKGVKPFEMAILVRDKKQARLISNLFLQLKGLPENRNYNFDVLSGESLFIENSDVICFIISLLTGFLNPQDQIVRAELNFLYYSKICPRLRESGNEPILHQQSATGSQTNQIGQPETTEANDPFNQPESLLIEFISGSELEELISGKPILELIYSLCDRFLLFKLTDELAYLQAFIDQISVFERNHSSDLTSFLNWWDENSEKFTIPVSDSINAIQVLTIHKSKGLEFSHVFVPFFNWPVIPPSSPDRAPLLWCFPDCEPFNEMEIVPVRYKNDLAESIFYREFYTEKFNTLVDNLNLMYVAFTRAKAGLWVWAPADDSLNTVGSILRKAVDQQASLNPAKLSANDSLSLAAGLDPEQQLLEIGEIDQTTVNGLTSGNKPVDVRLESFEFADFRQFLKIRQRGEDFFTQDDKRQTGINKGKLIHEILSIIETGTDVDKALKRMVSEGKIGSDEAVKVQAEISELISDPEVKSWFDGTYRIVNERNILTGKNGIKRPDRIMIGPEDVVIVDYKSGDVESESYKSQVRSYIRELTDCGYPQVSGYIWYTKTNRRVRV